MHHRPCAKVAHQHLLIITRPSVAPQESGIETSRSIYIEFELFEILYINLNIFQANSRLSSSILVSSAMVGYLADGSRIAILLCLRAPQHSRP